jgi:hypothetical protein
LNEAMTAVGAEAILSCSDVFQCAVLPSLVAQLALWPLLALAGSGLLSIGLPLLWVLGVIAAAALLGSLVSDAAEWRRHGARYLSRALACLTAPLHTGLHITVHVCRCCRRLRVVVQPRCSHQRVWGTAQGVHHLPGLRYHPLARVRHPPQRVLRVGALSCGRRGRTGAPGE